MRTPVGSCSAWPWEQARPSSPPTSDCPHTSAQSRPPTPSALRCYPSLPASWSCPSSSHLTIVRAAHSLCPCLPRWASAKPPPDSLAGLATFPRLITAAPQFFQSHLQCPPSAHSDSPSMPLRQTRHQQWPACPPASPGAPWSPPCPPALSPASPSPLLIPMDSHSCQAAVSPQLGAGSVSELEHLPDLTPLGPRNTGSACVLTWGLSRANKPRLAVLPAPHLHLHGEAESSSSGSRPSEAHGCFLCSVLFSELGLHVSLGPWGGGTPGLCQPPHC